MNVNLRLCEIFDTSDEQNGWFRKCHILLFGDPTYIRITLDETNKYLKSYSAFDLWKNLFHYDELTISMRQKKTI